MISPAVSRQVAAMVTKANPSVDVRQKIAAAALTGDDATLLRVARQLLA